MSKAFTKDDDAPSEVLVVPRAPLPVGLPNYVTPRGLAALVAEREDLERARAAVESSDERVVKLHALDLRLAELQARLASATVVDPSTQPPNEVRFGALVRVRGASGKEHTYRIVGVDEADASAGRIAFSSPIARALLGRRVGEGVEVSTPRRVEELEILAIAYTADVAG